MKSILKFDTIFIFQKIDTVRQMCYNIKKYFEKRKEKRMKDLNYSIRLTKAMKDHLVAEAHKLQLLPSEYLRKIIVEDMERKGFYYHGKTNK